MGKPVICSINGSCANFIINNEIGYTCASGDSEALANPIKELEINKFNRNKVKLLSSGKNIGVNPLVTHNLPSNCVVGGVPAIII